MSHKFLYSPCDKLGLGIDSLEDITHINAVTNTTITLNDWQQTLYWNNRIPNDITQHGAQPLETMFSALSNQYSKILLQAINSQSTSNKYTAFYLRGHLKGSNKKDHLVHNIARIFTNLGYSLDTIKPNQISDTPKNNHLIRVLTKNTYNKMAPTLMTHNIWTMGDFTDPSGTQLILWDTLCLSRNVRRIKPKWYMDLEAETLIRPSDPHNRVLKKEYWDNPSKMKPYFPFCFAEDDTLKVAYPLQNTSTEIRTYIYDTIRQNNVWNLSNKRMRIINLLTESLSEKQGALVTLENNILPEDTSFTHIHQDMHSALLSQCIKLTITNLSTHLGEVDSEGSMHPDSLKANDDTNTSNQPSNDINMALKFNSCSDGSVYTFPKGTIAAGHATVHITNNQSKVKRRNIPSNPTWSSPTTTLNHDPYTINSTDAEAMGLSTSIRTTFPKSSLSHSQNRTDISPVTTHTHVMDSSAVLSKVNQTSKQLKHRHPLREPSHYILDDVRTQLQERNFYNTETINRSSNSPPLCELQWIKGHSGNKNHDKADRHAARIAFRHTTPPPRYPEHTELPIALYFYECLVTTDIRQHVKLVCKLRWLKKWRALESQGKVSRLSAHKQNKLLNYKSKGTPIRASKFFAKLLNSVTHTPHQQHKLNKTRPKICPLCKTEDADPDHILHKCVDPELVEIRKRFDDKMGKLISPDSKLPYTQPHPHAVHPLNKMALHQIYPFANQLHGQPAFHIMEALPENRWYRKSKTKTNMIVIQNPYPTTERPQAHDQIRIPNQLFWTLIAWNDLTHSATPLPIQQYDMRAQTWRNVGARIAFFGG